MTQAEQGTGSIKNRTFDILLFLPHPHLFPGMLHTSIFLVKIFSMSPLLLVPRSPQTSLSDGKSEICCFIS